jgi:hypothetical protein
MSSPTLLRLPRELRDQIYHYYLFSENGYAYNFEANKLVESNGMPIDLSLVFTCRQIAYEMDGLALRTHKITFSTFCSETTSKEAGLFHDVIAVKEEVQFRSLKYLVYMLLTPEMAQTAKEQYPMFAAIIDIWMEDKEPRWSLWRLPSKCGEPWSLFIDFVRFTFKLLSKHPDFLKKAKAQPGLFTNLVQFIKERLPGYQPVFDGEEKFRAVFCASQAYNATLDFTDDSINPWDILDNQKLQDCTATWVKGSVYNPGAPGKYIKYAYSAASQAIRFMKSLSKSTILNLRNVVLLEDFQSVANPECHGRGLIPFCIENPCLHIERSVSLWQNAFPSDRMVIAFRNQEIFREIEPPLGWARQNKLSSRLVTMRVGLWIVEAHLLPSLGMPKDRYTLVLDGSPTPEKSTEVFKIIHRDMAWQRALDLCYARGTLPKPSWLDRRAMPGFHYEILPAVIQSMSEESSLVRCNFDLGSPHSPEAFCSANSGWSTQDWWSGWNSHEPKSFDTEPPLPPWYQLRWRREIL